MAGFDCSELRSNPTISVLTILFVGLAYTVYIPLCIYFACPLFKRRHDSLHQKRYVNLSLIAISYLILEIMSKSLNGLFDFQVLYKEKHGQQIEIFKYILSAITMFGRIGFINVIFVRFWLLYFSIEHNKIISNDEWKVVIDSNHDKEQNFFIKYKTTFGNAQFMLKCLCCDACFTAFIIIILPFLADYNVIIYIFIRAAMSYIGFIFVYIKMAQNWFYDDFCILKEFKLLGISTTLIPFIWGLQLIGIEIVELQIYFMNTFWMTVYLYFVYLTSMWYGILEIYIMSKYIIKQIAISGVTVTMQRMPGKPNLVYSKSTNSKSTNSTSSKKEQNIKLKEILNKTEYFSSFMCHLSKEFSIEIMFSFIEFVQFKHERCKTESISADDSLSELRRWEFSKCVPNSSIVFDSDKDWKWKATQLYHKYIMVGAVYEINVHHVLRQTLSARFQVNTSDVESNIFDDCIDEMVQLLRYSLNRFKRKPEWHKLINYKTATVVTEKDCKEIIENTLFI